MYVLARTVSRGKVNGLFRLYWLSCKSVRLVNATYSGIILSMIFVTGFHAITLPHYIIIPVLTMITLRPLPLLFKIDACLSVAWQICYLCQLFMIVIPPTLASAEGKKTAVIVCKYLSPSIDMYFLEELKEFVTRQNSEFVEFIATPLLRLRLPLLTSVVGITMTYFLVSVQIRNVITGPKL